MLNSTEAVYSGSVCTGESPLLVTIGTTLIQCSRANPDECIGPPCWTWPGTSSVPSHPMCHRPAPVWFQRVSGAVREDTSRGHTHQWLVTNKGWIPAWSSHWFGESWLAGYVCVAFSGWKSVRPTATNRGRSVDSFQTRRNSCFIMYIKIYEQYEQHKTEKNCDTWTHQTYYI